MLCHIIEFRRPRQSQTAGVMRSVADVLRAPMPDGPDFLEPRPLDEADLLA